jgi:hypothetical protein
MLVGKFWLAWAMLLALRPAKLLARRQLRGRLEQ